MSTDSIQALLKSRKTEDHIRAVGQISRLPAEVQQPFLLQTLKDRSHYVSALAAESLASRADENSLIVMLDHYFSLFQNGLEKDPGCHIRAHLAFAFGRLEYRPAADGLKQGIRTIQIEAVGGVPFDTGAHLRSNCALALAQIGTQDAVYHIAPLLFDTSHNRVNARQDSIPVLPATRIIAAQALSRSRDKLGLIPLAIKLTFPGDEADEVIQECMQALIDLECPNSLELLSPYLEHRDMNLAAFAGLMLARSQAPEAPALLKSLMNRLSDDLLRAVFLALTTIRSAEGRKVLHTFSEDRRVELRLMLIDALSASNEESDREILRKLAKDDDNKEVKRAANHALNIV